MPITPISYTPRNFVRNGTLGELLRLRGRSAAEHELRQGEISARMWSDLGQNIGNTITGIQRERQEAPIRAQEAESRALALQGQRQQVEQGARLTRQDTAFMALLEKQPNPDEREVMSIYGPQKGMQMLQGVRAFHATPNPNDLDAKSKVLRARMQGLQSASPALRATLYPAVRQKSIADGLITEQDAPPEYDEPWWQQTVSYGQQAEAPGAANLRGLQTMRAEADLMPQQKTPGNPTEASLAQAAAGGDKTAAEALRILRQQNAPRGPAAQRSPIWVMKDGQFIDLAGVAPPGAQPASSREQGRAVTSGDAGRIAELDSSIDDLAVLRKTVLPIDPKTGKPSEFKTTGTMAKAGAILPNWATELTGWGADAKSRQAVIDRVKQVIGKALEDGVLRKEDEKKYERILPTIYDPESVVSTKLDGLDRAVALRRQRLMDALADSGYDTSRFLERQQPKDDTDALLDELLGGGR